MRTCPAAQLFAAVPAGTRGGLHLQKLLQTTAAPLTTVTTVLQPFASSQSCSASCTEPLHLVPVLLPAALLSAVGPAETRGDQVHLLLLLTATCKLTNLGQPAAHCSCT